MMDRFADMSVFVSVVEHSGFSAAARRLDVTPQAVSKRIESLEQVLNVRLLNRTTRKFSLTEAGRAYYDQCIRILREVADADALVRGYNKMPRGVLRFNVTPTLAPFIAKATARFAEMAPAVSLDMIADDRMPDLVQEQFDLAVRITPVAESSLVARTLTSYRFVACASPDYLKRNGIPKNPQDLARYNTLIFSVPPFSFDAPPPWHDPYEWVFSRGTEKHRVKAVGTMRSTNGEALRMAAVYGQGIFFSPEFAVKRLIKSGKLVVVLDKYSLPNFQILALYPHRRHLSPAIRAFIDVLISHFEMRDWVESRF